MSSSVAAFRFFLSFLVACGAAVTPARAQHEGHGASHVMPDGTVMTDAEMAAMDHAEILGEPIGSGTSWLPKGSPVHDHAFHFTAGPWMLMTHGEVTARYTGQNLNNPDRHPPGPSATGGASLYPALERGGARFDAPNWAMLSAERPVFEYDRLMLRAMVSLDPLTIGDEGYPLLFQSGEGLADRQHPHDLFMELAVLYTHFVNADHQAFAYVGLPGEPALGPTAFMHRPSAGGNAEAPLAHHFQDATHITHGVVTLGWIYRRTKAEASLFRGREPDAGRWDIDLGALDSYSFRLTQNVKNLTLQGSVAYVHAPELHEHGDVVRTTASIHHNRKVSYGNWATSFIYGVNAGHHGRPLHSFLRESSLATDRTVSWMRYEGLQRLGSELDLPAARAESRFWVNAFTVGAGATVFRTAGLDFILGGQGAVNFMSPALEAFYGGHPLSGQVFLKIRPSAPKIKS
jgi:hypothetical protein